ncbi:MAG TPA: ATP-binding cassette domain-containing protein, partial [Burkholderiaceae bacterium]
MAPETAHPQPLAVAERVSRHYRLPRETVFGPVPTVRALSDVSFTLHAGRNLGIVGESGSGKSTLARLVMALERPDAGVVRFNGQDLA